MRLRQLLGFTSVAIIIALWVWIESLEKRPKFDQLVGKTESEVVAQYGHPKQEQIGLPAELLNGELRFAIRKRVRSDERVKELYYSSGMGERIFWLVHSTNEWRVVSDVKIPPGVSF